MSESQTPRDIPAAAAAEVIERLARIERKLDALVEMVRPLTLPQGPTETRVKSEGVTRQ